MEQRPPQSVALGHNANLLFRPGQRNRRLVSSTQTPAVILWRLLALGQAPAHGFEVHRQAAACPAKPRRCKSWPGQVRQVICEPPGHVGVVIAHELRERRAAKVAEDNVVTGAHGAGDLGGADAVVAADALSEGGEQCHFVNLGLRDGLSPQETFRTARESAEDERRAHIAASRVVSAWGSAPLRMPGQSFSDPAARPQDRQRKGDYPGASESTAGSP
jgi:hypothetical protein